MPSITPLGSVLTTLLSAVHVKAFCALLLVPCVCLQKLFNELDTDGDGLIDGGALHRGLATVGCNLSARDVREFLAVSAVDTHQGTGQIDINEFIAALFDSEKVVSLHPDIVSMTCIYTHTHSLTRMPVAFLFGVVYGLHLPCVQRWKRGACMQALPQTSSWPV